jgi:hypothetical protein
MKATRRETLLAALAVPAVAGMPKLAAARTGGTVLLHDPTLEEARRAVEAHGGEALAIEGDRIRFARTVFDRRPSLVLGVSRQADAVLIEEVGREAGYVAVEVAAEGLRERLAANSSGSPGKVISWVLAPRA